MTRPNRNLDARGAGRPSFRRGLFAMLALLAAIFAAAVVAPVATAQDPGSDQYSPEPTQPGNDTAPDGGVSPVPNSGSDSGDDSGATGGSGEASVPPAAVADDDAITGATGGDGQRGGNADDRTLDGLAASAEQQRAERNGGAQTTTQLSDGGGGDSSGIGAFVWIALAAIVLWAIGAGIVNYRRRDGDRSGEPSRSSGEQRTA